MAAATALIIGIWIGPTVMRWLNHLNVKQQIRGEGIPDLYALHQHKHNTPTMGGLMILMSMLAALVLWGDWTNLYLWLAMGVTLLLGGVGFLDDYAKLRRQNHRGLNKKQKFSLQLAIGLLFGLAIYWLEIKEGEVLTDMVFPFFKNFVIYAGWLYIPLAILVIVGTSNAVNLTDGLDGLAIGCVIIAGATYAVLAYLVSRTDYSGYLFLRYVPRGSELTVFCAALVGAGMAFLWYNSHPAEMFMGDTGSLALGGAIGVVALLIKQEFLLPLIGGIFVVEALSVIIQVYSIRRRGKKVFLMAPIHHHFEMKGWHESKVIIRFWIVAAILGTLGLATLKMR